MVMQPHLIHGIITVQIAHRNLEFPIDCPVCKLNTPESDDEEEAPEAAQHQLQTLTPSDRTCSDVVSAQLGSDAVDPRHAMQLHASHSTPSLETALMPHDSELPPNNLAGNPSHNPVGNDTSSQVLAVSRHDEGGTEADGFGRDESGLKLWLTPAFDLTARSGQHDSPHASHSMTQPHGSDQAMSSQHGASSPSFPIIASGTPITPSLIPTDGIVHQRSRLFSPHELTHASLSMSRASLGSHAGDVDGDRSTDAQTAVRLPPDELSQRSVSLGNLFPS